MVPAFAFAAGLLFGLGLVVAGMANPAKILGFLDIAGKWDPSLALVMVGAIAVGQVAFTLARRRTLSALGLPMRLPDAQAIDLRLVGGSLLFGIGWGLSGFCPGPAIVALGAGYGKAAVFVAAMLVGMGAFELVESRRSGGNADGDSARRDVVELPLVTQQWIRLEAFQPRLREHVAVTVLADDPWRVRDDKIVHPVEQRRARAVVG